MNIYEIARVFAGTALVTMLLLIAAPYAHAQSPNKWLAAGSFHNWYSPMGSEREHGEVVTQQHGWRWPGIYRLTDMQVAKSLWIGAQNVTDAEGTHWPVRVVHVGPRVTGADEFFPTRFELIARHERPSVVVDGQPSLPNPAMTPDHVAPDLVPDAMIISEANTLLGITVERRIMQFSQDYHDNYHVIEYTFTNTGKTGSDQEVTLPDQTLEDVYFFLQHRLAILAETRYVIGNATGWGRNTMNDARGDGVADDPPDEHFRAQFSWHGHFPARRVDYDNVGGPILPQALPWPQPGPAPSDTLGRLGASSFAGVVTLHADASPADPTDDPGQPATTTWISSDAPYQSNNSAFNLAQMQTEYDVMSSGHQSPRHAIAVEPTGMPGFLQPTGDPSLGTPGGFSFGNGYGPYTLAPGESVRIVIAEGAAGLSREANVALGRAFKQAGADPQAPLSYEVNGETLSMTKNEWVFTSRDSLFQTFRRAVANYESGYAIPRPPPPPAEFHVTSGVEHISLQWETFPGAAQDGFEIYRARGRADSTYTLIHAAGPEERGFDDLPPLAHVDFYYYIVSISDGSNNDGTGLTPPGRSLRSSRYFTQTYHPAQFLGEIATEPAGGAGGGIRLHASYPNPFSSATTVRFELHAPTTVNVRIYNLFGAEVARLADEDVYSAGTHELTFNAGALASGMYLIHVSAYGESRTQKVMLLR